ncbi:MAG: hypothetical protein JST30_06190 [Armatimonadetes bacterium]|nr:hypothetical protein [Armatimonadota bacterium]
MLHPDLSRKAKAFWESQRKSEQLFLDRLVWQLCDTPEPDGCGYSSDFNFWWYEAGGYRFVYVIDLTARTLSMLTIDHLD